MTIMTGQLKWRYLCLSYIAPMPYIVAFFVLLFICGLLIRLLSHIRVLGVHKKYHPTLPPTSVTHSYPPIR